jgi:hypothetical protein
VEDQQREDVAATDVPAERIRGPTAPVPLALFDSLGAGARCLRDRLGERFLSVPFRHDQRVYGPTYS